MTATGSHLAEVTDELTAVVMAAWTKHLADATQKGRQLALLLSTVDPAVHGAVDVCVYAISLAAALQADLQQIVGITPDPGRPT